MEIWEDSNRSIDLLALDNQGRLVVVELKRTQTGDHSELQAIRYAAMVSNMTLEQVVNAHRDYLAKRGKDSDARVLVLRHLGVEDETDTEIHTERPRILLASAGFSKELTASVLWLGDNFGVDIRCVKLQLYRDRNGRLLDTNQVIPLPNAEDYQVRIREKQEEARRQRNSERVSIPGSAAFRESIEAAKEEIKPELERLFRWAEELEKEGLAKPSTFFGKSTTLQLKLPFANASLVTNCHNGEGGWIELQRRTFEKYAPGAIKRVEEIIAPAHIVQPSIRPNPPTSLLDALTDAYREANGLPPTTPPPDTAHDSPAPAG